MNGEAAWTPFKRRWRSRPIATGLAQIAEKHDGPQMQDFLEQNYLHEQVEAIKELGDYVTKSSWRRSDPTMGGERHFDKELCDWIMVW